MKAIYDYVPTTEAVRKHFQDEPMYWIERAKDEWIPPITKHHFDAWLAEVKAQAIYDWVRLVQGKDNFTMDNARSFIDTMRIAEEDD